MPKSGSMTNAEVAEEIGLIAKLIGKDGVEVDLPSEIIEIYGHRNAIHLITEQQKRVEYELALNKRTDRRMRPFIPQIKAKLR